jgi:uncharacterized protein
MDYGLAFWLIAGIGVIFTGISKSGFAGGAGVVAVPLITLFLPIQDAIVVMLPLLLLMDAKTIHYYRGKANWAILKQLLPAAIAGIALAGIALSALSEVTLTLLLALISIVFSMWQKLTPILGRLPGAALLWGMTSGITSTLIHAGGPPLNIYLLAKQLDKLVWLATAGIFFGVMNIVKLIPYTLNEQWRMELFLVATAFIPLAFVGVWLGKVIQTKISEQRFAQSCRMLLLLSGILLLLKLL